MKRVFLFAGQGSQKAGMGKDLYETYDTFRQVVDEAQVSFDLKNMMQEAPLEELSKTEYTQPCMAAFAAGVLAVLRDYGITPDGACGLSLGEYGALHAAGVMDANTYIGLTEFRGRVMTEAAKGHDTSMSAVLGAEASLVEEACKACQDAGFVTLANYNCPGQYVICGEEQAVRAVEQYVKERGVRRCIRLNVSGPFHTPYMKPAGDALKGYFDTISMEEPKIPVVMNVTGNFYQKTDDLKKLLELQVQNSVRFEESIRTFLDAGAEHFVEIGPGNALSGFLKKTAKSAGKEVEVYTIDSVDSLKAYVDVCAAQKGE